MAFSQRRQVIPMPSGAPTFTMPQGGMSNSPLAQRSSTATTQSPLQQGSGGMGLPPGSGMIGAMAMRKMMGASPAALTGDGASTGAGASGIGASLGFDGAGNTTALGEAMTSAGPTNPYAPMGGITGMGTSPAAGPVTMSELAAPSGMIGAGGVPEIGAAIPTAADTAAFTGVGADAAVGSMATAAPAMEAPAAAVAAEGAALAPEAGILAGMGPMGWAALGGLGLFGAGKAFDWW